MKIFTFPVATRIELHPATDHWMRGDRFGEIVSGFNRHGREFFRVRLDRSGKVRTVAMRDIIAAIEEK